MLILLCYLKILYQQLILITNESYRNMNSEIRNTVMMYYFKISHRKCYCYVKFLKIQSVM